MSLMSGVNVFDDDKLVKFFFHDEIKKTYFVIKTLSSKEKQKLKLSYKFIIMEYAIEPVKTRVEFCSGNTDILGLIIKNLACNNEYKRHFSINKILKQNEENRS